MNNMKNQLLKQYKRAPVTSVLIALCVVIYVISFLLYGEEMNVYEGMAFGGYNPVFVQLNHEYYRLITANFIHFGIIHIAVNCYSLYGIGMFIESSLKPKKYCIVLFISALATTGLPYLLYLINGFEANTVSGGISGVIFGLIGALGALALKSRDIFLDVFRQLAPNLLLMLFISVVVPSISLSGHVAGMIGGFIATYIILHIHTYKKKSKYSDLVN